MTDPAARRRSRRAGAVGPSMAAAGIAIALAASVPGARAVPAQGDGVRFVDVTGAAGLTFTHTNGAFGRKYLPETMGSGAAFLDFDDDGRLDVYLVNSTRWPGRSERRGVGALFRNDGDGTFTNVTRTAGLDVELYGMGVTAADYDNDGGTDLYVTALGGNRLFRNRRDGTFADVTAKAGVASDGFGASAAFVDYDRDGHLDLFVANYVTWSADTDLTCTLDGRTKSYCTPESYQGQSPALFRSRGDGTFEDATRRAGLFDPSSKALGVALLDHDGDGWIDLFVANDTQPNRLYRNDGDGTFTDVAVTAGVAFSEAGVARAGMGVDAADYSGTGRPSLVIGNFSNEMMALYHNEGNGLYLDEAPVSDIGRRSLLTLAFATFFFDYDLDGRLDILAVNGHVADDISRVQPRVTHAQPPHLFRNAGSHRFEEVTDRVGPALAQPRVGRGGAYGDYDGDGDLDVLITANNGSATLLRNDGGNRNRYLRVRTVGTRSNRDGIGARVTLSLADGRRPWRLVHTGSSYLSQSERTLTFGLGPDGTVRDVEVRWPGGGVDRTGPVDVNRTVVIEEGSGMAQKGARP